MDEKLLVEFPPVSTAEWEAAIAKDLKGASLEEKLIWHAPEGLAVRPFYRAEDMSTLDWMRAAPGQFPYARGARTDGGWHIRERVEAAEWPEANAAALAAVAAGAEEIAFGRVPIGDPADLALLAANLNEVPLHFAHADEPLVEMLLELAGTGRRSAVLFTGFNPLANVDFSSYVLASAPADFVPFTIAAGREENAAPNAVEEIGAALAKGIEFLAAMTDRGIAVNRAASALEFSFAIGANYFFEVARLRAFRMLWSRVVKSFGGTRESAKARLAATMKRRDESGDAQHLNILRGTTAAMAAALGGADSICVTPFEPLNEEARRLARNTQLLLKHEAVFARVADAGGGSYCLESLTGSIATQAWGRMQVLEAAQAGRPA